jgi:hypothetical protein
MAYITEGDLEKFILQDIDATFSTWITSVIEIVEDYIDNYCGTNFKDQGSQTKYYNGSGTEELIIDNFQTITSVQILDSNGTVIENLTENSDYWASPYNSGIQNKLVLTGANLTSVWPDRHHSVKVVGTFGYDSVPTPVKLAGIQLCAKIINEGLRGGQVKSENLGSYRVEYKEINETMESLGIKEILNQYRELRLL